MSKNRKPDRSPDAQRVPSERLPVRRVDDHSSHGLNPTRARPTAAGDAGSDELVDLASYSRVIRRRWRLVLGVFAVVFFGVAIGTALQTPMYRATGIIEIRRAAEDMPGATSAQVPRITEQHLETEYEILGSPALALRVLDDLSGAAAAQLAASGAGPADALVPNGDAGEDPLAAPWEGKAPATVEELQENLRVDPIRGSRLVRIHYDAEDPLLAAQVVSSVIRRYTDVRIEAALAAESQLGTQVDSVRSQLQRSEQRLQQFVRGSDLVFVETGGGEQENIIHERLRRLQQELTDAEADRYEKESRYNLVRQRGVEHLGSDVLGALETRVADLRIEYARLRSTFTDSFPRTRQVKNQLDEMERLLRRERSRIAAQITNDYSAAVRRQALLREAFDEQRRLVDQLAGQTAEYHVQQREVESQQALFTLLQQKRKEAGVAAALAHTEVGIVNPPAVPAEPIRPAPARNMKLGAMLGLVLGLGMAFLREHTDGTVRTADEVGALSDRPVLALIPASDSIRESQRSAAMAEAFAVLRTSILLNAGPPTPRSLLVTSAQPQEGKTTVSTSLACSLAALRHRVLLIDADTRRPTVDKILHLKRAGGLIEYLSGDREWRPLVQASRFPGLDVLPAGEPHDQPADLLASPRMRELVDEAYGEYDFVIVDSPAVFINAADAQILAPLVDGVVLVIRSGVTPRDITSRVLNLVPHVMGLVLNGLELRHFPSYYGQYTAERGGDTQPRQIPHRMRA